MQTLTVLSQLNAGVYAIPMVRAINIFKISNVAQFIANTMHESSNFQKLTESLNYSVDGLLNGFGRHRISDLEAKAYGRIDGKRPANQQEIANRIYGGEWGLENLGNEHPGEGWRYRGRGPLMITGKANYLAASRAIFGDDRLLNDPDLLSRDPEAGAMAAGWFWVRNKLNGRTDDAGIRKVVNGGSKGLGEVVAFTAQVAKLLSLPDIHERG